MPFTKTIWNRFEPAAPRAWAAVFFVLGSSAAALWAQPAQNTPPPARPAANAAGPVYTNGFTLHEVVQRALVFNESIQVKMLEAEISQRQYKAERGIFEPAVVASYQHVDSHRENTKQQAASLSGLFGGTLREFSERNNVYDGGLEFLSPVGTKFRLGYTVQRLRNTLNYKNPEVRFGEEWLNIVGANVTQPLLKNFGLLATMARIRLAAISSDLAFQDYRRQLMLIVSKVEAAYWDLYLTQEQERISGESVALAETLLKDNRARVEVGKSSEIEVLQSEAGVALRHSRQNEARQKLAEGANQLSTLISGSLMDTNATVRAKDQPVAKEVALSFFDIYKTAFELNPDYLSRRTQIVAENLKVAYAKNQRLPQLDLKASYALNGLGDTYMGGFDGTEFPAWTIGLEMRVPITGGIKERNELQAAKLSQKKALVSLKEIEVQIGNALDTALLKVRNLGESVKNYQSVVDFYQRLLETQLARLEVGKTDSKTVLETEEKLFEAKVSVVDSLVQFQKALLELDLVQGSTLRARSLDLSKGELQFQTKQLLAQGKFTGPGFEDLQREIQSEYDKKLKSKSDPLERMREKSRQTNNSAETSAQETARRLLRQKMDEMDRGQYAPPAAAPKPK